MAKKILKPAEFAEKQIIEGILANDFQPGDTLPAERVLAEQIGVTRPTLRETLQRLSKEGWVTIRHGKPTRVNHYLKEGGLSILRSLIRYGDNLPKEMIANFLDVRMAILPDIAQKALVNHRDELLAFLFLAPDPADPSDAYARYDWHLQIKMVEWAENPVFNMIFNDFKPLYEVLGEQYFKEQTARKTSRHYYRQLIDAIENRQQEVSGIVQAALLETQRIWQEL